MARLRQFPGDKVITPMVDALMARQSRAKAVLLR